MFIMCNPNLANRPREQNLYDLGSARPATRHWFSWIFFGLFCESWFYINQRDYATGFDLHIAVFHHFFFLTFFFFFPLLALPPPRMEKQ